MPRVLRRRWSFALICSSTVVPLVAQITGLLADEAGLLLQPNVANSPQKPPQPDLTTPKEAGVQTAKRMGSHSYQLWSCHSRALDSDSSRSHQSCESKRAVSPPIRRSLTEFAENPWGISPMMLLQWSHCPCDVSCNYSCTYTYMHTLLCI